jgi:hypothetical protein
MISPIPSDRRRELRHFPLDHAPGLLWCVVSRTQPGTPGGDHHCMPGRNSVAQRSPDRFSVRHHNWSCHFKPKIIKS